MTKSLVINFKTFVSDFLLLFLFTEVTAPYLLPVSIFNFFFNLVYVSVFNLYEIGMCSICSVSEVECVKV